jgi:hypothetical protein
MKLATGGLTFVIEAFDSTYRGAQLVQLHPQILD